MAPNVAVVSSPSSGATPAFSLDGFIAQCRQKKAASAPEASQRPIFSLDARLAQSRTKRTASAATTACDLALACEIVEITNKLSLLGKAKQQVYVKNARVSEIMAELYPDLAIAIAVQRSNKKRTRAIRDTYGWR